MKWMPFALLLLFPVGLVTAQEKTEPGKSIVLFKNARVFDGKSERLTDGMHVLVVGNKIAAVSKEPIAFAKGTVVLEAAGRVLMPGMIDAHTHPTLCLTIEEMQKADD